MLFIILATAVVIGMVAAVSLYRHTQTRAKPFERQPVVLARNIAPELPESDDSAFLNIDGGGQILPCTPKLNDTSTWLGLAINGPKQVVFDAKAKEHTINVTRHAVIAGICALPAQWADCIDRLYLVFEQTDGPGRLENNIQALSQLNGMSISPARHEPSKAPPLTPSMLAQAPRESVRISYPNPNFSLFNFPSGTHSYRVYMCLDDLRSNELTVRVTMH